jgi:hypothetical protein
MTHGLGDGSVKREKAVCEEDLQHLLSLNLISLRWIPWNKDGAILDC